MDINSIANTQQMFGTDPSSFRNRTTNVYNSVAKLFNESPDQLQADLQAPGASLSSLAQSKGVSETDLENAIKQGLQQTNPNFSDSQLSNLANRIAHHSHHGHHHRVDNDNDGDSTQQTDPSSDPTQNGTQSAGL